MTGVALLKKNLLHNTSLQEDSKQNKCYCLSINIFIINANTIASDLSTKSSLKIILLMIAIVMNYL